MEITRILVAECKIPLPKPIKLGPVLVTTRDFVAIRAICKDGTYGDALGYPRGSALFDEVVAVAPYFSKADVRERRSVSETAAGRQVNTLATVGRALSLFEVAMADIFAKAMQQPWYVLNGGLRKEIPVMAVAGYYLETRGIDDVASEVSQLFDQGYKRAKIMLDGNDPDFDFRYASTVSAVAPHRIAADAHWSWKTQAEALRTAQRLDDLGLVFLEDPFGAHRNDQLLRLTRTLKTPLAAGEDMTSVNALLGLLPSIGYLRVDGTTAGGLTAALAASEAAGALGIAVLPHVFPSLHAQVAGASPAIEMIEYIPQSTGADPVGLLLEREPKIIDGQWQIDQEPGAGLALNWQGIEEYSVRAETIEF